MKLTYQTNIYEGPREKFDAIKLSRELSRKGWISKIYDGGGQNFSGEIFRIVRTSSDGNKRYVTTRRLATIEPGRIETHNYDRRLERFLKDYDQFLKGGERR